MLWASNLTQNTGKRCVADFLLWRQVRFDIVVLFIKEAIQQFGHLHRRSRIPSSNVLFASRMTSQSSDVVEALVREHLVRAGCNKALDGFNQEKVCLGRIEPMPIVFLAYDLKWIIA